MRDADVAIRTLRSRILIGGFLAAAVLAAVGLPWYLRSVETDLERRVPDELTERGVVGVTAAFSGQDGTLRCSSPLPDPESVLDIASTVRGVRVVTLERSCRVSASPTVGTTIPTDDTPTDETAAVDSVSGDGAGSEVTPPTSDDVDVGPAFDSLLDAVRADPQFSIFEALASESGVDSLLVEEGPFTLFAPADTAFESVAPDVLAELRARPDLLERVVRRHLVAGRLDAAALPTGPLETLDGHRLDVVASGRIAGDPPILLGSFSVDGVTIVEADLTAVNGVVHVLDQVLLPDDLELEALQPGPTVLAVFGGGEIELSGSVDDSAARAALVDAAERAVVPANVVDELEIDTESPVPTDLADRLGSMLEAAVIHLAEGSIAYVDSEIVVTGAFVSDAARDLLADVAEDLGATLRVEPRRTATDDDLVEIDVELGEILAAEPLDFEPGSAELVPRAAGALDRIAGVLKRYGGLRVAIVGYTDTAGSAEVNQALSEDRAGVVLFQLVARGVPFDQLVAVGRGSSAPVVVGGVEDPAASRRVEFEVELAPDDEVDVVEAES